MASIAKSVSTKTQSQSRPRSSRLSRQRTMEGWLFASPWILGFILWTVGPMIASLVISFTEWDLISSPQWVGTANIQTMWNDSTFWQALKVTTVYAVSSVPLHIVFGLVLALLLNTKIIGLRFYRTAFYLPSVLSGVAVALLWRWIFSNEFGLINGFLDNLGINGPNWLGDEAWALPSLVLMSLWGVGASAIIYLAGLQGIPTDLYEAAEVDGANGWQRFWAVTLPMMTPVLFFELITGIVSALQVFTQAYIMTSGGPNNATLFYLLYLYQNAFQYFRMGYASTVSWVIFLYLLVCTFLTYR